MDKITFDRNPKKWDSVSKTAAQILEASHKKLRKYVDKAAGDPKRQKGVETALGKMYGSRDIKVHSSGSLKEDQLDETSKAKAARYIRAAHASGTASAERSGRLSSKLKGDNLSSRYLGKYKAEKEQEAEKHLQSKRAKGIERATKKLSEDEELHEGVIDSIRKMFSKKKPSAKKVANDNKKPKAEKKESPVDSIRKMFSKKKPSAKKAANDNYAPRAVRLANKRKTKHEEDNGKKIEAALRSNGGISSMKKEKKPVTSISKLKDHEPLKKHVEPRSLSRIPDYEPLKKKVVDNPAHIKPFDFEGERWRRSRQRADFYGKKGEGARRLAREEQLDEKYMGFKKLEGQLSHEKGVYDPAGLAAAIGRRKYGKKGFSTHKHGHVKEDELLEFKGEPKKWMQHLHIKKGAFSAKAHAAGESTQEYAHQEAHAKGRTGKQARLALVFAKARHGKKKGKKH